MKMRSVILLLCIFISGSFKFLNKPSDKHGVSLNEMRESFKNPPDSARPGVYWYFMDGNLSREAMTADLESMKEAGIGYVLFLEVDVGVPRGKVKFLSDEWQSLFAHAVSECERLGISLILGSGPGWAGSGGPWVKPEQSMMHLVASAVNVKGPSVVREKLETPPPRKPFFGEKSLTGELKQIRDNWYEDVAVLAYPTPKINAPIEGVDEKALYYRAPYTSMAGVKQYLPSFSSYEEVLGSVVDRSQIIDLTNHLSPDGTLQWEAPPGEWTILRLGKRNNGAVTRPAPLPGLGFECDKFDTASFDAHYDAYVGKLLKVANAGNPSLQGGWKMIHIDSWEMGAQNWTHDFRQQFMKRRGYDPLHFLPIYTGLAVGSNEMSERFLWDVRKTSQELIIENHAMRFKELGKRSGMTLSVEPYDMNPAADLDLGGVADIPMCEFWSEGLGFNSSFSCIEAVSVAHVLGKPIVAAEAFTAGRDEAWKKYPGNMKDQGDWAFCTGINRFIYHTFAHKPYGDHLKPGVTMGPYGVHWDRGQTWWPMVSAYHEYISRCQYMLSQGIPVADILFLAPEGAPHVFRAPVTAFEGIEALPDKRGYSFDACSPEWLKSAKVENECIVFPGGASYRILALASSETMTPELLETLSALVKSGATVVGNPPSKSASLENYPDCDKKVQSLVSLLWGADRIIPSNASMETKANSTKQMETDLYPTYNYLANILQSKGVNPDFSASGSIRYTHRSLPGQEIYFISNRTDQLVTDTCTFRDGTLDATLWDALTGNVRPLNDLRKTGKGILLPVRLEPSQSFFVVFDKSGKTKPVKNKNFGDFPGEKLLFPLEGSWTVEFNPGWGGPQRVVFDTLRDWSLSHEEGIRHYSGIAKYTLHFDMPEQNSTNKKDRLFLDLGVVKNMARVKLNGYDLGVLWTAPWQVDISDAVKKRDNRLEIEVANLWVNRLIGDESFLDNGLVGGKWPEWLINGTKWEGGRYTFTTHRYYKKDDPLVESGLLGPVNIMVGITKGKQY